MSTSTLAYEARRTHWLARGADFVELTKPRIAVLVLITVAVAAFSTGMPDLLAVLHTLFGTALVAASASALNQWLERESDALMPRTCQRPLPAGRLSSAEVLLFGATTIVAGGVYLALFVNLLTALLGLLTWSLYVWVYTPLKSRTVANTFVGAIAGAMPVLMGWSAVGGSFSFEVPGAGLKAATLFLIVFLWQFPHFMAIAWIYRAQYEAAGLKMLSVVEPTGRRAGAQAILSALALIPVSLLPMLRHAGAFYFTFSLLLGLCYLGWSIGFCRRRDQHSARQLLLVSLIYLPAVLALFVLVPLV